MMGTVTLIINNTAGLPQFRWDDLCEEFLDILRDNTPVDTGYCQESWEMDIGTSETTYFNSAEYASYLDDGWSQQASNGMTAPSLAELSSLVDKYRP